MTEVTAERGHGVPATGAPRSLLRRAKDGAVLALGGVLGLAPHVLHHVGPLVGTALVAGSGGTALFGVLGLVASGPLLWRLRCRTGSWWAPALGLAAFAGMFALSAFVLGPAISDTGAGATAGDVPADHDEHHVGDPEP